MAPRQLTRSTTQRKVAGVAGGLAEYFNVDPTIVRVAWVVAGAMGWGILAYILLWVIVPEDPGVSRAVDIAEKRYARGEISADELERIRKDLEGP